MNPFTSIKKLIKTQKAINEMEKTVNRATNWKTSICGFLTLGITLALLWAPPQYQDKLIKTQAALIGAGLLMAKDHDVTGGERQQ